MTAFNPPRKRAKPKRDSNRVFPTHRAFVRGHHCTIPGCEAPAERIEFAHLRTAANSGVGLKPPDWFGIPLCQTHHAMAHGHGHETMAERCGIDLEYLFKTAGWLAARTPDRKMRQAMKEQGT